MAFEKRLDVAPGEKQPVCVHLRTKGMYVRGQLDEGGEQEEGSSSHCWCNQTQRVMGPDSLEVVQQSCVPGRECYERRF